MFIVTISLLLFDGNHDVGAKYALTLRMSNLC